MLADHAPETVSNATHLTMISWQFWRCNFNRSGLGQLTYLINRSTVIGLRTISHAFLRPNDRIWIGYLFQATYQLLCKLLFVDPFGSPGYIHIYSPVWYWHKSDCRYLDSGIHQCLGRGEKDTHSCNIICTKGNFRNVFFFRIFTSTCFSIYQLEACWAITFVI